VYVYRYIYIHICESAYHIGENADLLIYVYTSWQIVMYNDSKLMYSYGITCGYEDVLIYLYICWCICVCSDMSIYVSTLANHDVQPQQDIELMLIYLCVR